MPKHRVYYQASAVDFEGTCRRARALGIDVELGGGRGTDTDAQICLKLGNIDSTIQIHPKFGAPKSKITIYYDSLPNLKKCVLDLERCYVPVDGIFTLEPLGPDDPLDRSVELTTIYHWKFSDTKYAMARVLLYIWWDPETKEYIYRIPNREGLVSAPEGPYIYECCIPTSVHVIDRYDDNGNTIVDSEKLRWEAIRELKRIVREHPRFKPRKKI